MHLSLYGSAEDKLNLKYAQLVFTEKTVEIRSRKSIKHTCYIKRRL